MLVEATFLERINRFSVKCTIGDKTVCAYLPNPGRLVELLLKDTKVYLVKSNIPTRQMAFTCFAVERDGYPVLLDTHYNNVVAKKLIEEGSIEYLKGYDILKEEYAVGRSRFDFLLSKNNKKLILEVKSCTLFNKDIAMFPDAPTVRGKKHIEDLASLRNRGFDCSILFLVHSGRVKYFLPEYHTDLDFAKTLYANKDKLIIRAVSVTCDSKLNFLKDTKELDIPWNFIKDQLEDKGSYLVILKVKEDIIVTVGSIGDIKFDRGYYVYVGSAMSNLTKRIERHRRKIKKLFWHIDYLMNNSQIVAILPVRSCERLECDIAKSIKAISQNTILNFGSSDCNCDGHLFKFSDNPIYLKAFIDIILYYRMDHISGYLKC